MRASGKHGCCPAVAPQICLCGLCEIDPEAETSSRAQCLNSGPIGDSLLFSSSYLFASLLQKAWSVGLHRMFAWTNSVFSPPLTDHCLSASINRRGGFEVLWQMLSWTIWRRRPHWFKLSALGWPSFSAEVSEDMSQLSFYLHLAPTQRKASQFFHPKGKWLRPIGCH